MSERQTLKLWIPALGIRWYFRRARGFLKPLIAFAGVTEFIVYFYDRPSNFTTFET